jgi:hypothetical protein
MDPNANLREQREIIERVFDPADDDKDLDLDDLERLAELAKAMDEWLRNGGFLPDAWKPKS